MAVTEAMPVSEVANLCGLDVREVNRLLRTGSHGRGSIRARRRSVADAGETGSGEQDGACAAVDRRHHSTGLRHSDRDLQTAGD